MNTSFETLPQHIAIILDGNGRWARQRNLPRSEGHRKGGENLRKLIDIVLELKIPYLSLYVFSTENWKRPLKEIVSLWKMLYDFFVKYKDECIEKGIQIKVSGDPSKLPRKNQQLIKEVIEQTHHNKNLFVNFCINYGSHDEIVRACNILIEKKIQEFKEKGKYRKASLNDFERNLYTYPYPPVDLLIRPGGEFRISNFLLWQIAYAELYFTNVLWPDFSEKELYYALQWFSQRERRFGGILKK